MAPHSTPEVSFAGHLVSRALPTPPRMFTRVCGVNAPTPNTADPQLPAVAVAPEQSQGGPCSGTHLPRTCPRGEDRRGTDFVPTAAQTRTQTRTCSGRVFLRWPSPWV